MDKKKSILSWVVLLLLAILILVCSVNANATIYYVSATGSDGANGTSTSTPWQSITKINTVWAAGTFAPGDQILFKRGDTFYGSIAVTESGTSGNPITISNYGTGNLPVITGLITITGWGTVTGGVAESAAFTALPSKLQVILINGVLYSIGRWPDQTNWKVGVYRSMNSYVANASITDNSLPSTPDWDGATAVVHSSRWTIDNARISSHSGTTLNLVYDNAPMSYNQCGGTGGPTCNGYFIQDHIKTLTKFGEWFHNPSTDKISMYFGGTSPSSVTVQASTFQNLLTASSRSYITVDGLAFKGANDNCISISGGSNWIIKNCEISYSGRDGIKGTSMTSMLIDNNDIIYSYNDGINFSSSSTCNQTTKVRTFSGSANCTTTNNFINYTYFAAGMGASGNGVGNGIRNAMNSLVQYNTILNSGYVGIHVGKSPYAGNSSRILNNFIDTCLFVKDDGGGIYDFVGHGDPGSCDYFVNQSQKIIGNIVLGMVGAAEGVKGDASYKPAAGIYMDDGTNHCEITGNIIGSGPGFGLFLHNSTDGTVTNNTVYNNLMAQVSYKHDGLGWAVKDITSTGNVYFSTSATAPTNSDYSKGYTASYISTTMANMTWNNNYYAKPFNESSAHIRFTGNNYTFSGWKSASGGKDANSYGYGSTITWPSPITPGTETRLVYNETKVNKTIPLAGTYKDIQGNTYVCSITLSPFAGKVLIKTATSNCSNIPPTVSITAPANNATYVAPATVNITAPAADADGTVTKVEFYNGTTLLGTDNTGPSPYTFTWTSVPAGNYTNIYAKATDNGGLSTSSASIAITVTGVPPTVSIISPANGASFVAPASISINATASDADGTVTKVDFYNGGTILGTDNTGPSPYTFTWNSVPVGNYSITARATDNSGLVTVSLAKSITVTGAGNLPPTVSVSSPANNATYTSPATISITAPASDPDGTISSVAFYDDETLLGTDNTGPSPYTFTWNSVPTGTKFINARATDNLALTTRSATVTVTVSDPTNIPPTVSITSPANNATYTSPASISFVATASDPDGTISKIEFKNGGTLFHTENNAPYEFTWSNVPTGNYFITAEAYDNLGAISPPFAISITVSDPVNVPPTVSLTNPSNGATYIAPATVVIEATASDADGTVTFVGFYNGGTLLGTDNTFPYSFTWNSVPTGNYSLSARATDNDDDTTASSSRAISVTSANLPPTVSLTSPDSNATYSFPATIVITATASDPDGTVTSVGFYNGGTLLGTDNTSPYSFTWNSVPVGNYNISAKATDNSGAVSSSSARPVTVTNIPPTVSVDAPANNASYVSPATINMTATASDPDGTITSVSFLNGETVVGTDNTSPYTFSFSIPAAGTYQLKARATDNGGLTGTSTIITITVINRVDTFPTVNITTPIYNATYTAPANIIISADASDEDGTISKVEFYRGVTFLIQTELNAPYEITWSNVPIGSYSLTAKAYDNDGNITTSAAIAITVTNALPIVNITSPTNGSSFLPSATILFKATATDANGTITNVKFYDGSTLMQTETIDPYEFTRGGFAAGSSHIITAVATDNNGGVTTSSPVTFTISSNPTPVVTVTAPTEGQVFTSHTNIVLTATATDDGTITNMKFYNGATLLNTDNAAPYTFTWNDVSVGAKVITFTATDNLGATGSAVVNISVENILPTVSITSPANGASFVAPASISITASATDANGTITKVDFYNGSVLIGTDNSSPYTFTWTGVPTGTYSLTTRATDNDGGIDTSAAISVTSTNTPPTVSLSATITSVNPWNVNLVATTTDVNGSILKVDFYEGSTLITTEGLYPYEYIVVPTGAGTYSFTVEAMDNDSATTTSNTVTLTLAVPTVSITSVTVTDNIVPGIVDIAATATDNVSVAKVDFYANGVLIGTDLSSPYTLNWTGIADGVYTIYAIATDNDGATSQTLDEAPIEILASNVGNVSITNLFQTYDGTPKPVDVTIPGDYPYDITYSDVPTTPPTDAGSYSVHVEINDGVHSGSATETLVIAKADPGAVWPEPNPITYLTPLSAIQLDSATADVPGTWVFTPASGTVLGAGTQTLQAIFTPTDITNYKKDTVLTNITVNQAVATLTITSSSSFVYDGQPKVATATVTPDVGIITITYNGSLLPPKTVGVYTIAVTLEDNNYAAEMVSGTLEITPVATPSPTETRNFLLLNRSKIVNLPQ